MPHQSAALARHNKQEHTATRAPAVVGPSAVAADRSAITLAVPFAGYRARLFNSTLEVLAEPSRFLLRALSREGITIAHLLTVTGLEAMQIERLLLRLRQFQLLDDDETLTDYGRQLGRALDRGLHGAEATLWVDRLGTRTPLILLSNAPLLATATLASGTPRLAAIDGRSEVFRQEQRLFSWLQHINRQLPLQHLIETLWGEVTVLPNGPQAGSQAWQLQLPLEQAPTTDLFLPVSMPMPETTECAWLLQAPSDDRSRLLLPALDWRIRYQTPAGLDLDQPPPPEERFLHCLVSNHPLTAAEVQTAPLNPAPDWPLLPTLERLQSQIQQAPPYLERAVSIQVRGRTFGVDHQSVLTAARHEYADHAYHPAA